jgi:hypothetical protein
MLPRLLLLLLRLLLLLLLLLLLPMLPRRLRNLQLIASGNLFALGSPACSLGGTLLR